MNNGFNQTTRKVSCKCKLGQIEVNSFSSCQQQQLLDNSLDHQARASCETEPFGRKLTFEIKNDNYSAAELQDFEKFLFCCKIIKYLPQARVKWTINSHTAYINLWGTLRKSYKWHSWRGWLYRWWAWLCVAVGCRYNAVQNIMIFHTSLKWLGQNMDWSWNSQKTPHISP